MIITIDGPAASGKSTIARALAHRLHYYYVNSGMLYRALGYCLLHNAKIPMQQLAQCDQEIKQQCLESINYSYDIVTGTMKIYCQGVDVSSLLKNPEIDTAASLVGESKQVRTFFLQLQRDVANDFDIIAEGRDVGSVVFPHADVKIFLTARPEVRALRWLQDFKRNHSDVTFQDALMIIKERDARDIHRQHAPLHVAEDAIVVDNSILSFQETLDKIITIVSINTE